MNPLAIGLKSRTEGEDEVIFYRELLCQGFVLYFRSLEFFDCSNIYVCVAGRGEESFGRESPQGNIGGGWIGFFNVSFFFPCFCLLIWFFFGSRRVFFRSFLSLS